MLDEAGCDSEKIFLQIKDVVIKTVLSIDSIVNAQCNMFVPYPNNCFDLMGFDILIDERQQPWLLEVNMSPSLACESKLDTEIKSALISDLFTLLGIVNVNHRPKPKTKRRIISNSIQRPA